MTPSRGLVHLLRNIPVREILRALEHDGFTLRRSTRTGGHVYSHPDGRTVPIHYHTGRTALSRKTLASVIRAARWTEDDIRRLELL